MNIYCFEFPIRIGNEDRDIVSYPIFIKSEQCPTHVQVVSLIERLRQEELDQWNSHDVYTYTYDEILYAIDRILTPRKLPFLIESEGMVRSSVVCKIQGMEIITVTKITVYMVE